MNQVSGRIFAQSSVLSTYLLTLAQNWKSEWIEMVLLSPHFAFAFYYDNPPHERMRACTEVIRLTAVPEYVV